MWPVLGMVQHPESCVHERKLVSWPHQWPQGTYLPTPVRSITPCISMHRISTLVRGLDHPCKRDPTLPWNIDSIQAASAKTIRSVVLCQSLAGVFCARLGPHRRARYTFDSLFAHQASHQVVHEQTALVAGGTREYQRRKSLIPSRPITTPACGSYTARQAAKPSDMFHQQRPSKLVEAPFRPTFDGCFPPILFIWP